MDRPVSINLVDPGLYSDGDPFVQWRWLRANEPVYLHGPTEYPSFWALTKYEDVKAVFRDAETFSSAQGIILRPSGHGADPGGGRTLALSDPPRHRQLRGLVDEWFAVRSVRAIEAKMREVADRVIDLAVERERCDFVGDIAARIPLYMICGMMGVPESDWEALFTLSRQAFEAGDAVTRRFAHLEIMGYFEDLTVAKAAKPADDVVSVLVTAEIEGRRLSQEEIILICDNLFVGGTENTRIAAAGGMLAFLEHPDQWRRLVEDPALLPTAVEEVLRWTSTTTHIARTASRPVEIRGRRIDAGDLVTMWIPSANRDDELFTDPDRFDVSRQPNRHLALGFGEHFCVGSNLTRVEIRLLYQKLIDRSLTIEPDGEPRRLGSIVVNGLEHMPVKLVPGRYLSGTRQVFNWLIVTIERETMMAAGTPLVAPPRAGTRLHLSENPYGPSPHAVQAVTDSLRCLHRYPDPSYHDLITGIAFHYNIDPDRVVVGNGADEIILMLALAAREAQRPAIISENTFQSYSMSLRAAGVPVTAHPLIDYSFPVEEFIASFGAGASIAFVCNPHNPVGGILSAESVDCLCAVARENDVIVVFDEAYAEYTDGEGFRSAISAAANDRNVCVMRTFSKAYGLAALRIGYVVGDPAVVARLRHMQMAFPFHVNRMGQAAAIAALRDQEYLTRIREKNRVARDLLYLGLSDLGITYFPSHANFVLAHLPGSASHVARELRTNAGMYVRDTADLGLTDHLRISVGRPDEMSAFVSELAQVMAATPGP